MASACRFARAGYVAFKEKNAFVDLRREVGDIDAALREGQQRFLDAIARIEAGELPAEPGRAVDLQSLRVPARVPQGLRR